MGNDKLLERNSIPNLLTPEGGERMQKVFFISDHHFGHKQIIDFGQDLLKNVEVMNASMIESWNSVVGKTIKYSI